MPSVTISAEHLIETLNKPNPPIVLDCRCDLSDHQAGRRLYSEGHIVTAVHVDLETDLSSDVTSVTGRHPLPSVQAFVAVVRRLGISQDRPVVAYDDSNGAFAARLWWMLTDLGHTDVQVLERGFQHYQKLSGPVEVEPRTNPPGTFTTTRQWSTVSADEVLSDPTLVVVDARAPARFAGELEPIDSKAGHVPGAYNLPFERNLGADGLFCSTEQIKANFAALSLPHDKQAVVMCGSGVTACHLLLARAVAGLPPLKLYAGSWSEWITDPNRPIETD